MALNPRFIHHVSAQLALVGTTLFNMGQVHAAMAKADQLLADETASSETGPTMPAVSLEPMSAAPEAKANDAGFATALDELTGGAVKTTEELHADEGDAARLPAAAETQVDEDKVSDPVEEAPKPTPPSRGYSRGRR